jgi:hypothetical protein
MQKFLVVYVIGPNNYRGRWMEGRNYDDARSKLRRLGFMIYTTPIGLAPFQID